MRSVRRLVAAGAAMIGVITAPCVASAAPHVFDLASHMPPHMALVFAVNWFGVPAADPQGGAGDPSYGNWRQEFPACGLTNDPSTCAPFEDAGAQRVVASKRRPLAGIYSSSGRTPESLRRVDLMLSTLRTSCGSGARLDAFILQLDSVKFTSAYPQNKQSGTWDIAYRATRSFLDRGDAAGLSNAVVVGNDSTVYWHFGDSFGLSTQDQRKAALQDDVVDMAKMAMAHPSSVKIDGRPLLAFYVDSALMTTDEWTSILEGARATSGIDFYALATTLNGSYFAAFDALSPWVNLGIWGNAQGADLHARAVAYATDMHQQLLSAVKSNPGRVVFGGVAPGFDDYTENWGACTPREIPRDPPVLQGQMDYLASIAQSANVKGVVVDTWDDWTEGTEIEPDVSEGAAKLVELRQLLGSFYGEPSDPAGDAALEAQWRAFGQPRSCCFAGGACVDAGAPPIPLACDAGAPRPASDAGARDASAPPPGVDAGAPFANDGGDRSNSATGRQGDAGGCGCVAAPSRARAPLAALFAIAGLVATRRRSRRPER